MNILKKLESNGSNLSRLNGVTPAIPNFKDSKLHNEYSINGEPKVPNKPTPSNLDLNGVTPPRYTDNKPS